MRRDTDTDDTDADEEYLDTETNYISKTDAENGKLEIDYGNGTKKELSQQITQEIDSTLKNAFFTPQLRFRIGVGSNRLV